MLNGFLFSIIVNVNIYTLYTHDPNAKRLVWEQAWDELYGKVLRCRLPNTNSYDQTYNQFYRKYTHAHTPNYVKCTEKKNKKIKTKLCVVVSALCSMPCRLR